MDALIVVHSMAFVHGDLRLAMGLVSQGFELLFLCLFVCLFFTALNFPSLKIPAGVAD